MINRKERERLERREKFKSFGESLFTLLLNIGFFAFVIAIVLGFMYL